MRKLNHYELINSFDEHKKWIDSLGLEGKRLTLDEVDFKGCNLVNVNLEQAYITESVFDDMKFENYSFYLSKLCSSSFRNTNMLRADFTKAELSYVDFSHSSLHEINMNGCECFETNFSNAEVVDGKLTDNLFDKVDMRNTKLQNVDISYSSFELVLMDGVILKNIIGFENASILSIDIGIQGKSDILLKEDAIIWIKNKMSSYSSLTFHSLYPAW